jgi:polyisoprenoid-binding protein YceI
MKKLVLLFAIATFLGFAFTNPNEAVSYEIDNVKSTVVWKGYKVTGSQTGTIALKNGELIFKKGNLESGKFEIDMSSITVAGLSGENKSKLEGHLKSPDFFGVAKNPTATFKTTSVKVGNEPNSYNVVGNLTIKNITKEISFVANVDASKAPIETTALLKIDRSKFNVRYGSNSFFDNLGDKAIYDEFDLEVKLLTK